MKNASSKQPPGKPGGCSFKEDPMGFLKSLFYHFRQHKRLEESLERYTQIQPKATMIEIDEHQIVNIRNSIGLALNLPVEILPSWREP